MDQVNMVEITPELTQNTLQEVKIKIEAYNLWATDIKPVLVELIIEKYFTSDRNYYDGNDQIYFADCVGGIGPSIKYLFRNGDVSYFNGNRKNTSYENLIDFPIEALINELT